MWKTIQRAARTALRPIRRKGREKPQAKPRWSKPFLEPLEDRTLLSITLNSLTVPSSGQQGQALSFSARAVDSQGAALDYAWDFGGG